jgi:hypothetical protein
MKLTTGQGPSGLRMLLATAVGTIFLISPVGQAQAHHNNIGTYAAGRARCDASQIWVHPPVMGEAQPLGIVGGSQQVAFRSHLAQLVPGVGWRTVSSGVWKTTRVNSYGVTGGWTTLSGQPVYGSMYFHNLSAGTNQNPVRYRVFTEYYWYADQNRHAGSTSAWNPHEEGRGSFWDQKTYEHCKYPGPNDVTIL